MDSAWEMLTSAESDDPWDRFYAKFRFQPSVHSECWPSILEPIPSLTWKMKDPWSAEEEDELCRFALDAFRRCVPQDGGWLYALDWQHDCYRFRPGLWREGWQIPPFPNGDYYIFLTPDLSSGWFGHPWEWTICVFGDAMLAALGEPTPAMFTSVLRRR